MIYLSLGSNLGNRIENLQKAVLLLRDRLLQNLRTSIILETEAILPLGSKNEWNLPFLNMVVAGDSDLSVDSFFDEMKKIQSELDPNRDTARWSPRMMDIDILYWDNICINSDILQIPHKELNNRPFLLHLMSLMGYRIENFYGFNNFNQSFVLLPKFMGILNVTEDSFSDGGRYTKVEHAVKHALFLANSGATIIDIGTQSTRPSAIVQKVDDEYARLKDVLDELSKFNSLSISVDTFHPSIIKRVIKDYDFVKIINDVTGRLDDKTLTLIKESGRKICTMHSLSVPPVITEYIDEEQHPILTIVKWSKIQINKLLKIGFNPESIIIDPGIGFGKSMYQNIEIIQSLSLLRNLGVEILIGHSRKSYISSITKAEAKDRDIETIAHSFFMNQHVDIIRVHNVLDHMRFFAAYEITMKNRSI